MSHNEATKTKEAIPIPELRLTTQTVIIEYDGLNFDEFRFDVDQIYDKFTDLLDRQLLTPRLSVFKSKRFSFHFNQGAIKYQKQWFSVRNEMNSAIHIEILSKNDPNKIYKLQVFRQGKIKICGVTSRHFEGSDADDAIQEVERLYDLIFDAQVKRINVNVVMQNFVTHLDIDKNERLDLINMLKDVKEDTSKLTKITKENGQNLIHFDLSQRRVVLYCKLEIKKPPLKFKRTNAKSTSNRRLFSAITFLLTQRGSLLLQGCSADYNETLKSIDTFQQILNQIITPYLVKVPDSGSVSAKAMS